jgi:hypothetical protein
MSTDNQIGSNREYCTYPHFLHGGGHSAGGKDWKALKSRLAIIHGFGKSRRGEAYWQPLGGSVNYSPGQ